MTMWQRVRPTVIILSMLSASLAAFSVWLLVGVYTHGEQPSTEVLVALSGMAGLCIGSLLTLAGQCAVDTPPPAYPAKEMPEFIDALGKFKDGG